ncbi:hypothetical protein [Mesorhizobium sp. CN2-181]|uniref:hypothetical protein n=1 Tax=Mesorhizobium yinganensis TaxID=3157707 RepID=UPI0032B74D2D
MKNKLIVIGWLGVKQCYLNVSREEAIRRYVEKKDSSSVDETYLKQFDLIEEFEFGDEFSAYDAWK